MKKEHPERVHPEMARVAMSNATRRVHLYTEYILVHYHATGHLAPGCDARDLYAWLEKHMPKELMAITMPSQNKKRTGDRS